MSSPILNADVSPNRADTIESEAEFAELVEQINEKMFQIVI